MFRSLALCLLVSLSAAPGAAQTKPAASATAAPKPIPRANFIVTMDGEFKKADANNDGQLTKAEIEALQRAQAVAAATQRARAAFAALDTDKNGQLSYEEFARLASARPPEVNAQPMIASMDSSKDGKISLIEHRAATLANFDRLDTDKDGIVTPAEMKAAGIAR